MPLRFVAVKVARLRGCLEVRRALALLAMLAACSRGPEPRQYELQRADPRHASPRRARSLIKHEDIKGFMPGMTMPFKVKDAALLEGKQPGDLVTATLVVGEVDAHLSSLTKTGHARRSTRRSRSPPPTAPILMPGDVVPDQLPRRPGRDADAALVAARPPRGADVHLHALPAARLLSADGPQLRGGAEDDRRARRRSPTCGCVSVTLRPGVRHAGRAQDARAGARRRSGGLDAS